MAIDEADSSDADSFATGGTEEADGYSWIDFYAEYGEEGDAAALREATLDGSITPETFDRAGVDPAEYLGFDPAGTESVLAAASENATHIDEYVAAIREGQPPVVKGWYSWEDYKHEYFYDGEGNPPAGEEFDPSPELGFDPERTESVVADAGGRAQQLFDLVEERTVDVNEDLDEDAFFSTGSLTTIVNRYDLEKAVPLEKKRHFREVERYWVNKPFAFVILFHSTKENEKKYYLIQPHMNEIEDDLAEFLTGKLRSSIKYAEEGVAAAQEDNRRQVIEDETYELLDRYDIYSRPEESDVLDALADRLGVDEHGVGGRVLGALGWGGPPGQEGQLEGIEARPESVVIGEDPNTLNEYQVEKLLYYLKRDFIGYERIDGIKHDINVEDISCDGYNSPVFVYHSDYEQIITNIYHGEEELDDFVVKLAQRSGKGISKRSPQVDATLPDGSRAQLTLGREVSDHGTNYTIRQFKDVPFTPIDLINWHTFSLDEMAFLWLCIENNKSLIFAGGTASGKTTSLNAVSLFIPSNSKIVSIEDTREVELPQRNWIASVTRPSFSEDGKGDIDEFDLLEAALRQRPDYIVMGEVRGQEGRTLFQVMSTGHTTYTTFHADSVGEVLKRFTTDPINVSKTMFTALDLVSIQTSTRVAGHKVRRNKTLTEINRYDAENDEINVQDVYQWQAESDQFLQMTNSNTLEEIKFDRGWDQNRIDEEIFKRKAVLAYLIDNGLNTYTQVAATFQAFINDPDTILTLMANEGLEASLEDLREMESVHIDIDPEKEEMVPRPDPDDRILELTDEIIEEAEERVFDQYRGEQAEGIAAALMMDEQPDVAPEPGGGEQLRELTAESDASATEADEAGGPGSDASGEFGSDAGGGFGSTASSGPDTDAGGDTGLQANGGGTAEANGGTGSDTPRDDRVASRDTDETSDLEARDDSGVFGSEAAGGSFGTDVSSEATEAADVSDPADPFGIGDEDQSDESGGEFDEDPADPFGEDADETTDEDSDEPFAQDADETTEEDGDDPFAQDADETTDEDAEDTGWDFGDVEGEE